MVLPRLKPGLVALVIIPHVVIGAVVQLESSAWLIIEMLKVSKCSSSESRLRSEGGSIGLSH